MKEISAIVIDDSDSIVAVFSDYLELNGIDVIGCGYNGKDAVYLYKKCKPDIVFLDLVMPKYDGVYALRNIRQIDPNANVIIVTAKVDAETNTELMELKPTAIFHKPFRMDEIMETVTKLSGVYQNLAGIEK